MLDYDGIQLKFIRLAQQRVGHRLSQGGPNGDEPNVIELRHTVDGESSAPNPPYPYITVDLQDTTANSGWQTRDFVDVNGLTNHQIIKRVTIRYRCYGDKSRDIINDLHSCFAFYTVRDDLRATIGAGIVLVGDIDSAPIRLSTNYLESAAFNVVINIVDTQVDTLSTTIDGVNLNGE